MPVIWKSRTEGYFVDKETKEKWEQDKSEIKPAVATEGSSDPMLPVVLNGVEEEK